MEYWRRPVEMKAMMSYSQLAWERAAAGVALRAAREVPFYREQSERAGREIRRPEPVPVAELADRLWALCPISRPYVAAREPTLWTGVPADLAAAVRRTGVRAAAVLEVRSSWVDWTRLGPAGPRYAPVLAPDAVVRDQSTADGPARTLAASPRVTALVSPPEHVDDVVKRTGHRGPVVRRLAPAEVAGPGDGPAVVFDRRLGYFAALAPGCGRPHVLWQRFHVCAEDGLLVVTALRRTRPTLVRVALDGGALTAVAECPRHGEPVLAEG